MNCDSRLTVSDRHPLGSGDACYSAVSPLPKAAASTQDTGSRAVTLGDPCKAKSHYQYKGQWCLFYLFQVKLTTVRVDKAPISEFIRSFQGVKKRNVKLFIPP